METFVKFLLSIILTVGVGLLIAFPVMWLWNYVIPDVFALYTLCNILMKGATGTVNKN